MSKLDIGVFFVKKNVFEYWININWVDMESLLSRVNFVFWLFDGENQV